MGRSTKDFQRRAAAWHIVTCEYPPQTGGVSDYARLLAEGLARAGESVQVWSPAIETRETRARVEETRAREKRTDEKRAGENRFVETQAGEDEGRVGKEDVDGKEPKAARSAAAVVRRELGRFSLRDLRRAGKLLDAESEPRRLLVQYVPHGYGWRAMNVAFCLWLLMRAGLKGDRVEAIVHEPFLDLRAGGFKRTAAAAVQRLMATVMLRAASRVWVSTPAWGEMLRPYALGRRMNFEWLPVPSAVRAANDAEEATRVRGRYAPSADARLVGHFGTHPRAVVEILKEAATRLLARCEDATLLLIGRGSEEARSFIVGDDASLASRVHATGELSARELSAHIAACDLMLLPFPDGVTTRRTSAMAALAHGRALVTTKGRFTETLWIASGAVELAEAGDAESLGERCARLLAENEMRARLGATGRALYHERFDAARVVASLLKDERRDDEFDARSEASAREASAANSESVAEAKS